MIRNIFLFLYIWFCVFCNNLRAQEKELTATQKNNIQLIRAIEKYAHTTLGFKLKPQFYTKWETNDSMTAYVYISKADSIKPPKGISTYLFFGTDYVKADSAKQHYDSLGYHTIIYKTAGNSACKLSSRLLAYPPHALAFICFHELFHRHRQATKSKLLYSFEEATCDVMGNYATIQFLEAYSQSYPEFIPYIDSAKVQANVNEQFYQYLLNQTKINQTPSKNSLPIIDSLPNIKKQFNIFQQDRFDYPINNAFKLRTLFYAKYYFDIKTIYLNKKSLKKVLKYITKLKGTESSIYETIVNENNKYIN